MVKKVLIAEDEIETARFLEASLKREGYEVNVVSDGQEAKNRILEESPDAILLDLGMPGVDGFEVLRWLRQEQHLDIPAIIVSAKDKMEDIKKGYNLDADHYIVKPIKIKDVLNSLQTIATLKGIEQDES